MHPKRLVLWIIWFAITTGFCMVYVFFGQSKTNSPANVDLLFRLFPSALIAVSLAVRFLVIPRVKSLLTVLPPFVVGLSLAEGSGILAIFLLSRDDAQTYFGAALFALLAYAPLFANKLETDSNKP